MSVKGPIRLKYIDTRGYPGNFYKRITYKLLLRLYFKIEKFSKDIEGKKSPSVNPFPLSFFLCLSTVDLFTSVNKVV